MPVNSTLAKLLSFSQATKIVVVERFCGSSSSCPIQPKTPVPLRHVRLVRQPLQSCFKLSASGWISSHLISSPVHWEE